MTRYWFWSIEEIQKRNISAKIYDYLSTDFLGIGSNGQDKFYGLDFTIDKTNPSFCIVPMGDLSIESKYKIGESIIDAFKISYDGNFNDQTYDDINHVELSDEIATIKMNNKKQMAENFWNKKDYKNFIILIDNLGN